MKKGLRLIVQHGLRIAEGQNDRPDEEGIKTWFTGNQSVFTSDRTTDLMKKGLRPGFVLQKPLDRFDRTTDLMKKGLRPSFFALLMSAEGQNDRPDEEGIKTVTLLRPVVLSLTERQT